MEIIENLQKLAPWAADLPIIPKIILSLLIVGIAGLFLSVIWTTPSTLEKKSIEATTRILSGCYKRAIFTRTHAQMNHEAMFSSITSCRQQVQNEIPHISIEKWKQPAANILAALEAIEREEKSEPWDFDKIDTYKLQALKGFQYLSRETKISYPIPENLTEEVFFDKKEADLPPTINSNEDRQ
jgi:hypothetical protein